LWIRFRFQEVKGNVFAAEIGKRVLVIIYDQFDTNNAKYTSTDQTRTYYHYIML